MRLTPRLRVLVGEGEEEGWGGTWGMGVCGGIDG